MHKISYVLGERFSQDPFETYFRKQHPSGAWKDNLSLYESGYANTFRNWKVFKPIVTGNVRDENMNFESDIASSMSEKNKTKQYLLSLKVSNSHLIPSCQASLKEYINEKINKLIWPYFNSFCQLFCIPFQSFMTSSFSVFVLLLRQTFSTGTEKSH